MPALLTRRRSAIAAATVAVVAAGSAAVLTHRDHENDQFPWKAKEFFESTQGEAGGGEAGDESAEARTAAEQLDEHRFSGGIVAPGAYSAAYAQLNGLGHTPGSWSETTNKAYDADDPNYRDYYSNSSGGAGYVTGRITGLAADGKTVYAAGADGGVFRSTTGGGGWQAISDQLPNLSSGDLRTEPGSHALWLATGEANTGATSFVGSGVYRLADGRSGQFTPGNRVGGTELESTVIQKLRFGPGKVFAATSRGIYVHSLTGDMSAPWQRVFAPNPAYLPGGASASDPNAPYKNIVNDVAVDPHNTSLVIAAVGWRGGDTYNGFYESTQGGAAGTWSKVNIKGGADSIDSTDVGFATLAYSADGSKLYAVVQSIKLYSKASGTVNSYLKGVYVSNSGSVEGPFTKIADSQKLANSGSALKQSVGGKGYGPGIQSWYNQFLQVDPANPQHLWVGLEEVYESWNGGSTWTTPGPYWNFYFSCWNYQDQSPFAGCQQSTHSDQHSVAVGQNADGTPTVFVGNDGGVYSRPVKGVADAEGHAKDWRDLNDGTIDALQYYSVGLGKDGSGVAVSGGLQDNGGSILRAGATKMSSNFGGDGGDTLVDPNNGCNIVQEYVDLSMRVTQDCAHSTTPDQLVDITKSTTYDIAPPDSAQGLARFIAPFDADRSDVTKWIAGGRHVWTQGNGFAIRKGSEWTNAYDLGSGHLATALAMNKGKAAVAWCGPCNNAGFTRGIAVGTYGDPSSWHQLTLPASFPNRYIGGVTVASNGDVYATVGGFSRRFTEGPGAGYGHVFKSTDNGATWTSLDKLAADGSPVPGVSFPDVPGNSVKVGPDGSVYVGTDLGVVVLQPGATKWQTLGSGLPLATVTDLEPGPDGRMYASTHGRGIWSIAG